MTSKTRTVVVAAVLVLVVGLATGLVAYMVGLPGGRGASAAEADLRLVPASTSVIAFVDMRAVLRSSVWQRMQTTARPSADSRERWQRETGINLETDIDHVLVALPRWPAPRPTPSTRIGEGESEAAAPTAGPSPVAGALVLLRGRFDAQALTTALTTHGATTTVENGHDVWLMAGRSPLAASLLRPDLLLAGSEEAVRAAIRADGAGTIAAPGVLALVHDVAARGDLWMASRMGTEETPLPSALPLPLRTPLPALDRMTASARLGRTVQAAVTVEAHDAAGGDALRDLARGGLALLRLQVASRPSMAQALNGVRLSGGGRTMVLTAELPVDALQASPRGARSH